MIWRTFALLGLLLTASCAAGPGPSASGSPAASSVPHGPSPNDGDVLPNLVMTTLSNWRIELDGDRRLLRLTTVFSNIGVGAFELRGVRANSTDEEIALEQVVFNESGGSRELPTEAVARFAGDGHEHWHAQGVVTLALSPLDDPGDITTGDKIHFCFFDNIQYNLDLPGAPESSLYLRDWCGTPEATSIRMGLSVGWGDMYHWDFAYQWIDITDLPGGTYQLRVTVDAGGNFLETDDTDNCQMSQIAIPSSGEGEIVVIEASDQPC